jgi:hypothetical protein
MDSNASRRFDMRYSVMSASIKEQVLEAQTIADETATTLARTEASDRTARADLENLEADREVAMADREAEIDARAEALANSLDRDDRPISDLTKIDDQIAVQRALIAKIAGMLPARRADAADARRRLKSLKENQARQAVSHFFETGNHLLKWSAIADLTIRQVIEILATKPVMSGDPRVAIHIPLGRISDADWLKIKENGRALINA